MEERQSVKLIDQVGDDLGARMQQAVRDPLLGRAIRQVVFIVGTDVPSLPLDHVQTGPGSRWTRMMLSWGRHWTAATI